MTFWRIMDTAPIEFGGELVQIAARSVHRPEVIKTFVAFWDGRHYREVQSNVTLSYPVAWAPLLEPPNDLRRFDQTSAGNEPV